MKKLFRSFTFWFIILSFVIIFMHQIGQDSKSIVLIGFNPILNTLSKWDMANKFMQSGLNVSCNTISGSISIYWYIGSIITLGLYGFTLDLMKYLIKER